MSVIVGQAFEHFPKKQIISPNADVGGWSFLQSLCETKGIVGNKEDNTKKTAYVHPVEKRSVSNLSLEMCTETLGTENGSDSGDDISLLALDATKIPTSPLTTRPQEETNYTVRESSFPPPLNSDHSRMVKSYTEDGRLVVQAIKVCSPPRCFLSERCEGRLRLCLSEDSSLSNDEDEEFEENNTEFGSRDEDEDEEKEEELDDAEEEEGIVGDIEKFEGKTRNKKFTRPIRRCHENGREPKTMLNWKQQQFWVTS
ncbi:unnamed protein product [Microthlaspi erraticum]|uniref:FAF domain-containing protein n=1 Tax=Microthlaspi erraticum TaxID=1685480 RepID=A0A6D2KHB5_9BRAS|nr:unnamed protein product [Microthlaspi erraticum]CAA7056312.1 unnamed protein product [Microthlaspi erraticum]